MQDEDTEERYRQHLAFLIGRTKSSGTGQSFNQFVHRCKAEAAAAYPRGAAAVRRKQMAAGGLLGVLAALLSIMWVEAAAGG
ncbi:hypothetical protein G8A07_05100 [Roseateles sp. DAIF2]|uniref:hypothetical protein n=1 Tax=Roseateles sp. DAIF2 TaxID=2714952 RepID=UPI0018A2EF4D|nr:hypothetical protein [Roseateles sp. DAIF2]QPF72371.1 hypothetical protein G8A07_05100 [Roseateles sp. DAIF2]